MIASMSASAIGADVKTIGLPANRAFRLSDQLHDGDANIVARREMNFRQRRRRLNSSAAAEPREVSGAGNEKRAEDSAD